jgi:hypothetical protein
MKRRNFILMATTAAAAVAIPSIYYKYSTATYNKLMVIPQQLAYLVSTEFVVALGVLYTIQFDDENSERELVDLLLENITSSNEITSEIDKKITTDYQTNKTVTLEGWVLSQTEARQCALFSLTQSKN